jgi:hypothetical protein
LCRRVRNCSSRSGCDPLALRKIIGAISAASLGVMTMLTGKAGRVSGLEKDSSSAGNERAQPE